MTALKNPGFPYLSSKPNHMAKPKLARKKPNIKSKSAKLGMAPGSLIFTGEQKMTEQKISVMRYSEEGVEEFDTRHLEEVEKLVSIEKGVAWVNIDGLHDVDTISALCTSMGVHKLTMEDILGVGQRPKLEEFDNYLFVVMRMFLLEENGREVDDEQLSFILQGRVLITFQEKEGDVFSHVRNRIREGKGMVRKRGADYLLYALIDSVVDYYFLILEKQGENIEIVEEAVLDNPQQSVLNELHRIRREVLQLRRSIYPLREVMSRFERVEEPHVSNDSKIFIRDLYDHTIQVIETVEVFRDMISGTLDLYMNSVSNKMNNVMKVLTIIATIFIPLTFIAGVYGMNFENMPELAWPWAYYAVMVFMFSIGVGMIIYFKVKKWF